MGYRPLGSTTLTGSGAKSLIDDVPSVAALTRTMKNAKIVYSFDNTTGTAAAYCVIGSETSSARSIPAGETRIYGPWSLEHAPKLYLVAGANVVVSPDIKGQP